MQIFREFFSILNKEQKRKSILLVLGMCLLALFEAVGISAILPLITIMSDDTFSTRYPVVFEYTGISNSKDFIIYSSIVLIFIYLGKNIFSAWLLKKQINFSLECQVYFATKLNSLYLSKPYIFHLEENSSNLIRNISASISQTFSGMMVAMLTFMTEIITVFFIWSMIAVVDVFTAVIVAGFLTIMIVLILKTIKNKIVEQGRINAENAGNYVLWLNQGLGAIKETKVACKESFFAEKFNEVYNLFGKSNGTYLYLIQMPRFVIETLVTCSLLILIIVKIKLGESPSQIVPVLGLLALAAFRLMPSANRIINQYNAIKFNKAYFDSIKKDLYCVNYNINIKDLLKDSNNQSNIILKDKIEIKNLKFRYPKSKENVLTDISFSLPVGSFVGIIGKTGAGKTTFVDILLGLFEPQEGEVLVDNKNIFSNIRSWQRTLSYVPQAIYLVDGSIKDNIALGIETNDVDDVKIEKALKMAELYEFVESLTDGINTHVGERGVKLSGGQKQRIGIARALYSEPQVLILDEATSALDNETETNITETILKLKGQITIIAIAHRISTLKYCDFKIEFADGECKII